MSSTRRRKPNGSAKVPLARKPSTVADNWGYNNDEKAVPLAAGASLLLDYSSILGMVAGGCCSNVLVYEQLLLMNSRIGSALTFSQMLFIAVQSLPSFISFTPFPRLKPRQAPLSRWALQVLVITAGSLLNNWAYAFNVPFTLLIVFRSAGLAVSMLMGYFVLKRTYTSLQIISVIMVSIGVVVATLARPSSSSSSTLDLEDLIKYVTGISMLTVSLILTGILGILQEQTYHAYGPCWKEGIFYTHALSLPVFLFLIPDIKQGFSSLSKPSDVSTTPLISWAILGANLASQLVCVSGVNKLSTQVSSVSTNLVLTARKALSLCLSVWWYRSGWNFQLALGASMVFLGSLLFTSTSSSGQKETKKDR